MHYDHSAIEKKWQQRWEEAGAFKAQDVSDKPKFYGLIEFPYPSGQGLHIGHPRPYTALDIVSRKKRMQGYNVLFPMGWDAFGLPAEQHAKKTGIHPRVTTENNIANLRRQLKALGFSGTEIGNQLERLLYMVIDDPDLNKKEILSDIFPDLWNRKIRYESYLLLLPY